MSEPLLLSFRKAAQALGVGRNSTLQKLIKNGSIRPVMVAGRQMIPREQLEQLARHGENPSEVQAETPKRGKAKRGTGSIADLKIV